MSAAPLPAERPAKKALTYRRAKWKWERPAGVPQTSPVPRECWCARDVYGQGDALSSMQRGILRAFDGQKFERVGRWFSQRSQKSLARELGACVRTIRRNLHALVHKGYLRAWDVTANRPKEASEGDSPIGRRRGEGNATVTTYQLIPFEDVMRRIAEDAAIGKSSFKGANDDGPRMRFFVRGRGRHFMTPAECLEWNTHAYLIWLAEQPQRNPEVQVQAPSPAEERKPRGKMQEAPAPAELTPPPEPLAEIAAELRQFKGFSLVDDKAVEMVWKAITTAAAGRPLTAKEMGGLVADFRAYYPAAANAAYVATSIGGRTRFYLNKRRAEQEKAAAAAATQHTPETREDRVRVLMRAHAYLKDPRAREAAQRVIDAADAEELVEARARVNAARGTKGEV